MNVAMTFPVKLKDPSLLTGRAYIGGRWRDGDGGATFPVVNPSTLKPIQEVADCSVAMTTEAIDAAYDAQKKWAKMLASERCALVEKLHDLMVENADDLAAILAWRRQHASNHEGGVEPDDVTEGGRTRARRQSKMKGHVRIHWRQMQSSSVRASRSPGGPARLNLASVPPRPTSTSNQHAAAGII